MCLVKRQMRLSSHQVGFVKRLDQIGHGTRISGALNQLALGKGCQDHHRCDLALRDLLGRRNAIQLGHLDIKDHQVRLQTDRQIDRISTVISLGHHLVALLGQHLSQVQSDQGLVLGNHDTAGRVARIHTPKASGVTIR